MFVDQTQPDRPGAIREILPEELDRISGGCFSNLIPLPQIVHVSPHPIHVPIIRNPPPCYELV